MSDPVSNLARRCGILPEFVGLNGHTHRTSRQTEVALLAAMGIAAETEVQAKTSLSDLVEADRKGQHPAWRVVPVKHAPEPDLDHGEAWQLHLEDGTILNGRGRDRPPTLPLGRHLFVEGQRRTWLLASPESLPAAPRSWGVTAPLFGMRSPGQGGIGEYEDLRRAALALAEKGAAFLGINPVHAGFPTDPDAFSPYSPSHRQWLNVLHIAAGAAPAGTGDLIDYPAESRSQLAALHAQFKAEGETDQFNAYLTEQGESLTRFATHQALSDEYGPYWKDWPRGLQRAGGRDERKEARALAAEIRFHAWAQYKAESQLSQAATEAREAGMAFGLYLDLAVGTHPYGAETWENPGLFAQGASLGAPPDAFSPDGQNWNLAPMVPRAMEAEGFATIAAILRRQFRFAGLLRIDHILGFDRAFWTTGRPGVPGAYVKMPLAAMLAVTRIEAARAGATVIGEDLGNIPSGLQSDLRRSGLSGCRLVMFEHDLQHGGGFRLPRDYDKQSLASFSTHDLPTWQGWRAGADIAARCQVGQMNEKSKSRALAARKAEVATFDKVAGHAGMHGFLAKCAADLVAVQIENVFDVFDQPNLPGTVDEYPNWRRRLPVAVADYAEDTRLDCLAKTMNTSGRGKIR